MTRACRGAAAQGTLRFTEGLRRKTHYVLQTVLSASRSRSRRGAGGTRHVMSRRGAGAEDTLCLAKGLGPKTPYDLQRGLGARHIMSCEGAGAQNTLWLAERLLGRNISCVLRWVAKSDAYMLPGWLILWRFFLQNIYVWFSCFPFYSLGILVLFKARMLLCWG